MSYEIFVDVVRRVLTRDNVTFVLAMIGSIGTLYTFIMQRTKIRITIQKYGYANNAVLMYLSYENLSHLSVAITSVSLIHEGISYPCAYEPTLANTYTHKVGKETVTVRDTFTIAFSINLSALSGASGYIYFSSLPDNFLRAYEMIELEVGTNRGRAKKMKLKVPVEGKLVKQ